LCQAMKNYAKYRKSGTINKADKYRKYLLEIFPGCAMLDRNSPDSFHKRRTFQGGTYHEDADCGL
ncbi:hypothetical protein, partial [uncultured Acetatifactor sp.]|uniref:hypothetical protein n=1 Tax=uncultured Acetatifactor sp. TaxID=1671927 RepID=UPI002620B37B